MKTRFINHYRLVSLATCAAAWSGWTGAQAAIELARSSVTAGGAVQSTGGAFELNGTIGQSATGLLASESFSMSTGLWLPLVSGDCDADGAVSIIDYESLASCLTGPGGPMTNAECPCFDLNADDAVDLRDFALYTSSFTGP